jgi:hypothetical protein
MVTETEVLEVMQECNEEGRTKTLAEFIATIFKDKFVEIYLGDSYEEVSVEQISTAYPAVFCGKVVGAYKECLVLNCVYINKQARTMQLGNMMFVSERAIRGLNEIDGKGIMEDMFLRSTESLVIKEHFVDGHPLKMRQKATKK